MSAYEIIVKTEEIRKKVQKGDYTSALRILETIELKKVKKTADLSLMAETYMQNGLYEEAFELYLKVYLKTKTRKALFQLVSISIKKNSPEEARMYLREYEKLAPRDFYIYIFRYQIDKRRGEPYEVLIRHLLELKEREYIEEWAYELAKLYYKAGMEEECIRECSDIILWFGEGSYVEKAKVLKAYYSGEADKDMIIEELKKRALQDTGGLDLNEIRKKETETVPVEDSSEYKPDSGPDGELMPDGELIPEGEFKFVYTGDDAVDRVMENMRKDVEEILSGGASDAQESPDIQNDTYARESPGNLEDAYAQESSGNLEDAYAQESAGNLEDAYAQESPGSLEGTYTQESPDVREGSGTENAYLRDSMQPAGREAAELEVEKELYRLLDEEDDDSRRLKEIAREYDFSLTEVFGNFMHVKAVRRQLAKSLDLILDRHTKSVQMIITGPAGSGKTALAKDISVFLNKVGRLDSSKIAKISAEKLNEIDVSEKRDSLSGCCLVIENASDLKASTVNRLLELIRYYHGGIAVIFEEEKRNMNKLFRVCPKLMDLFKNRIHLPRYTDEEMLGFAYAYLKQKEYRLQKGADAYLKNTVYQILKNEKPDKQLERIILTVQSAMQSSDIRMGKQLPGFIKQGRLGDIDMLTILPEDFITKA